MYCWNIMISVLFIQWETSLNGSRQYWMFSIIPTIATELSVLTWGKTILSCISAIRVGHKTCPGQRNVSQHEMCHLRTDALIGISGLCQLSCFLFGKITAYLRWCLSLTFRILEWRNMWNSQFDLYPTRKEWEE